MSGFIIANPKLVFAHKVIDGGKERVIYSMTFATDKVLSNGELKCALHEIADNRLLE